MIIAPAALSLSTKSASCAGTKSLYMREPYVVRIPAVNARSLTANGKPRSEEHTSELQSRVDLVCRLLLEKKKKKKKKTKKKKKNKKKKKKENKNKKEETNEIQTENCVNVVKLRNKHYIYRHTTHMSMHAP